MIRNKLVSGKLIARRAGEAMFFMVDSPSNRGKCMPWGLTNVTGGQIRPVTPCRGRKSIHSTPAGSLSVFVGKRDICTPFAEVVKLVDTHVSGACVREDVGVRVPPSAQIRGSSTELPFLCASGRSCEGDVDRGDALAMHYPVDSRHVFYQSKN